MLEDLIGATNCVQALNAVANEIYPVNDTQGIAIMIAGVVGVQIMTCAS